MKKRTLIERRKALKEAYYNELKKAGVIAPKVKTLDEMTKKELIELALSEGLELNNKLTKAVMIDMFNKHINSEETEEETPVIAVVEQPEEGTIEDIDIPDITEEQVQAVANAIVEQSEEDNKSIDQVVNEIVEESKEETSIEVH